MINNTHIDFAWHSKIDQDSFLYIEQEIERLLFLMAGFDDLDHAEMFHHNKYRLVVKLVDMEDN